MKAAVIVITDQGVTTASRVIESLHYSSDLFIHEHCASSELSHNRFQKLSTLLPEIWGKYSLLIFIMATGIVVRQISTFLGRKDIDPAVLVMDDNGKYVISLLSGHLGGANSWTRYIAQHTKALPVITTATDGKGITAPDEYSRQYNWYIGPLHNLPHVNRTLVENGCLKVWSEYVLEESHPLKIDPHYLFVSKEEDSVSAELIISSFINKESKQVFLVPQTICLGVGCRSGTKAEDILEVIHRGLYECNISEKALKGIYSIDIKAKEKGIIEAAALLKIPFITFTPEAIQKINKELGLDKSEFVHKMIGVDGVCEAASLLGTNNGQLILKKIKSSGITLAISKEKYLLSESVQEIPLI